MEIVSPFPIHYYMSDSLDVIQKVIERVDPEKLEFIINAFKEEGPNTVRLLKEFYHLNSSSYCDQRSFAIFEI